MALGDQCDVCGQAVAPEEAYRAELSAAESMCPAPMTFHRGCYEQASEMWKPDPDASCAVDPDFPEMAAWQTPPEELEPAGQTGQHRSAQ